MISQFKNLFSYKELLLNFAKKELKVKYKNSVLGFLWSLLNPILMMLVFTFVFTFAFKIDPEALGIDNYPIFFLAGLLPWNFFNASVVGSTTSIVGNASLIKKVYFPRELLPVSITLANLVNFGLEMIVFVGFLLISGFFNPRFLSFYKFFPYLLLLVPILFIFTLGISFLVSALNVYLRDIQHLVGILLMVLFYSSPIIYPIPPGGFGRFTIIYLLNPMTAIVLSFKDALYYLRTPSFNLVMYSIVVSIVVFLFGYYIFLRLEPEFAEEV
ncbi:MAG TPA: ABC transporter permease [Actinobacteria bacterium]|nr:ABC transporter permease [Actinomycetota bacterium]